MWFRAKNRVRRAGQRCRIRAQGGGPEGEKESGGKLGDGPGIMGVPSKKNRKGHLTWNQRKRSQVRLRSRPGTPSGVEEETWQGPG